MPVCKLTVLCPFLPNYHYNMEVIITHQPEMDSVVTMVELDTQQIKYLIDLMWSTDPTLSNQVAVRHNVDDVALEKVLNIALGVALDEC